jgi:hypothetical protein
MALKQKDTTDDAYDQGFMVGERGTLPRPKNPYDDGTPEHDAWERGVEDGEEM